MKTISGKLTGTPKLVTQDGKDALKLTATGAKGGKTEISLDVTSTQKTKLAARLGGKGPDKVEPEITQAASIVSMIQGLGKQRGLSPALMKTLGRIKGDGGKKDQQSILSAIAGVSKALKAQGLDVKM